jgi:carbamoyl-phosphate synthase large subunit
MIGVLLLGGGGPAGINVLRCLAEAEQEYRVVVMDQNPYHLKLASQVSCVSGCWLQTERKQHERIEEINKLMRWQKLDVIHAQPDSEVAFLSDNRDNIEGNKLLPSQHVINTCQNKLEALAHWQRAGVRKAWFNRLNDYDCAARLSYPCWIRAAYGAGGRGSTPASDADTVDSWIDYWRARGKDWLFIAEELLPGRNIAVQTLWHAGVFLGAVARERDEYIYPYLAPSGVTGTPSVAHTVLDQDEVVEVAKRAVLAVDPEPNGAYSVDLKGNKDNVLQPTEINIGRFFTTSLLTARLGCNMPDMLMRLAVGLMARPDEFEPVKPNTYWIRHMDSDPILVSEESITRWLLNNRVIPT